MLANGPWSYEGGEECLRIGAFSPRSWTFFWPGRVVVEPLTDGVVWAPRGEPRPLPLGTKLVAPPNAAHLRVDLPAGALAKVRFAPAADIASTLGQVYLPEIVAEGDCHDAPRARTFVPGHVARAYRELVSVETELTLEELADRVRVERCHLCRSYQRTLGLPPYRHRQHLRVARARALLRAGHDCTVVAHRVGFCDQSHFTRNFKELTGTPPSVYARAFQAVLLDAA